MSASTTNPANPYAPPKSFVQDVVDPNAGLELAGRGKRLGAVFLDGLIWGLVVYAPLIYGGIFNMERIEFTPQAVPVGIWAFVLVATVALAAINIYYVYRDGQTLSKKWLGIKVVRKDGSRATLSRIFWLRNVVSTLPGLILGGLWTLIDSLFIFGEQRQCVHDKIADTIVVNA